MANTRNMSNTEKLARLVDVEEEAMGLKYDLAKAVVEVWKQHPEKDSWTDEEILAPLGVGDIPGGAAERLDEIFEWASGIMDDEAGDKKEKEKVNAVETEVRALLGLPACHCGEGLACPEITLNMIGHPNEEEVREKIEAATKEPEF